MRDGVPTKALNLAVKRNRDRFPQEFAFRLTPAEAESLRFQFETSKKGRGGRRYAPWVFSEHGVAMLSSVLTSRRAVRVNIEIIRAFILLRQALTLSRELAGRMAAVEAKLHGHGATLEEHAAAIAAVFADIKKLADPPLCDRKRRIGFSPS